MLLYEPTIDFITTDIAERTRGCHRRKRVKACKVLFFGHLNAISVMPHHHIIGVQFAERCTVTCGDRCNNSVSNVIKCAHTQTVHR